MRMAPLVAIIVFVLLISSTLGTVFVWVIAGLSTIALIALMTFMYRADSFIGPSSMFSGAPDDSATTAAGVEAERRPISPADEESV